MQQGSGSKWPYQALPATTEVLIGDQLKEHYTAWKAGSCDKTTHPLFLAVLLFLALDLLLFLFSCIHLTTLSLHSSGDQEGGNLVCWMNSTGYAKR